LTSKPPAHDAFLTTEEVLEYLQVNLRTVYRLIKSKSIPAVRVGRQWRFKVNLRVAGYLTKPHRDSQVLEAAARALSAPAA
jgi:excisionase family DNA binding protein